MKHIEIIPNFSGITEMIKSGDIAHNFLVKSENDGKVHFSNALGYQVLMSGGVLYNMYINHNGELEVDYSSDEGFSFQLLKDGLPIVANIDISAIAYDCEGPEIQNDSVSLTGVSVFDFSWQYDTSWQINYYPEHNLIQVDGRHTLNDEECCEYHGGTWNLETGECEMPSCEDQGLCDDGEGNCYPCDEPTCEDECDGDPECECTCLGPDYYWDSETETCMQTDPCDGDPECECLQMGGYWNGEECIMPEPEPVEEPEEPEE